MRKKTKIAIGVFLGLTILILVWMWVSTQFMAPQSMPTMAPAPMPEPDIAPPPMPMPDMAPAPMPEPDMAPPPTEDSLQAIDRILERMEIGNIAFNAPKTMKLHDSAVIHLVLGVEREIEDIKRMIEEEGDKVGASIRVSNRMEARLSGRNFEITAINPEVQAVARREVTEWKWEIKPRTAGKQNLHLTLSALLSIEGESTPRVIRTFDRIIIVEVTIGQQAKLFVKNNWQWLWAAVLVPIVGWMWKRRKRLLNDGNNNQES